MLGVAPLKSFSLATDSCMCYYPTDSTTFFSAYSTTVVRVLLDVYNTANSSRLVFSFIQAYKIYSSTSPSTKSVDLVGSWDNFVRRYPMERDSRKGAGEWRGLHSFKDITLDGDGARSPKRNGGLKMGHDYWYYVRARAFLLLIFSDTCQYELNNGTEIHNTRLPSTTSCPYLPGQPVNVLSVPTQINPLRERSASEGAMAPGIQTMNPADKFLAPRAAPAAPRPKLPRLNTAPSETNWNPMASSSVRSASENGPRSPWSARSLFGLRAALSALPGGQDRGRIASPVAREYREANIIGTDVVPSGPSSTIINPADGRSYRSTLGSAAIPGTMSSQEPPARKTLSRDASPLRHSHNSEHSRNATALTIPDEIAEEEFEDDDANFATAADIETSLTTRLSPPPTRQPHRLHTASPDIKPLPKLPDEMPPTPVAESPSMVPAPLHVTPHLSHIARSHFSIDTISTEFVSPTESHFSSAPSIYDSNDDEDGDAVIDDSFTFHSASTDASPPSDPANGFQYSLPVDDHGSEATLKKGDVAVAGFDARVALRQTFGPQTFEAPEKTGDSINALDQLLAEMGFLGDMIVGKEV
jgi:hypothetical protein